MDIQLKPKEDTGIELHLVQGGEVFEYTGEIYIKLWWHSTGRECPFVRGAARIGSHHVAKLDTGQILALPYTVKVRKLLGYFKEEE